jgi:hypothetical protein
MGVVTFTLRPIYHKVLAAYTHWRGGWVGPRVDLDTTERRNFSWELRCSGLFKGQESLDYVPIGCAEVSGTYYQHSLRNRPEDAVLIFFAADALNHAKKSCVFPRNQNPNPPPPKKKIQTHMEGRVVKIVTIFFHIQL